MVILHILSMLFMFLPSNSFAQDLGFDLFHALRSALETIVEFFIKDRLARILENFLKKYFMN